MEIKNNGDGTFELTNAFSYQGTTRIITVSGYKKHNKLTVDVSITPPLKGRMTYVCTPSIHTDVEIINGDIRIIDESWYDEYPKDVIVSVKKILKEFYEALWIIF